MATTYRHSTQPRRAGFTLIELLAVMLLILTVLGMGVPAMFAAERKSYVNQAMNELIQVHQACMAMQRELAARGIDGEISLTITNPGGSAGPRVNVVLPTGSPFTVAAWTGRTFPLSINSDDFISRVDASVGSLSWNYERQTGFISGGTTTTLNFKALWSGSIYKVNRSLTIYPQGYSEIP